MSNTNDLTPLIDELVSASRIRDLLRVHKDSNKDLIRLTGNKSHLIDNLLECLDQKIIKLEEVYSIIQEAEEFGNQYVFLYKTLDDYVNRFYNDGQSVSKKIFGQTSHTDQNFPKIKLIPDKLEWVDFRVVDRGEKDTWTGKLYDKKTREKKISEERKKGQRIVIYEEEDSRVIYLVKWDGAGILEIRISRTRFDSSTGVLLSLNKIWNQIKKGVDNKHLPKWNLQKAVDNILRDHEKNEDLYKLSSTSLEDSQRGTAVISSFDEDVDIFAHKSRSQAIDAYLGNQGKGTALSVNFLAEGSKDNLTNDVRVILCRDDIHQMIIPARLEPKEYNYVKQQILKFNKRA